MRDERRRLTRAQVLSEALDLVDEEGLEALTMRTLADRLDVVPMALYRHVRNKDDLMEGLLDQAVARVDLPDASLGWRAGLTGLARSIRGTMLQHPALAARVIDRPSLGPSSLVIGEYGLGVLRRAGCSDEVAEHGLNAVLVYTLGFVALEVPRLPGTSGHETLADLGSEAALRALASEDFPHTLAVRPDPGRLVGEEQFTFGLECILDGIGRRGGLRPTSRS